MEIRSVLNKKRAGIVPIKRKPDAIYRAAYLTEGYA